MRINLYMDQVLEGGALSVQLYNQKNEWFAERRYLPGGEIRERGSLLYHLSNLLDFLFEFRVKNRRTLSPGEQSEIHSVYPYIYEFHGLESFDRAYEKAEKCQEIREEYEQMQTLAKALLSGNETAPLNRWQLCGTKAGPAFFSILYEMNESRHVICVSHNTYYCDEGLEAALIAEIYGDWVISPTITKAYAQAFPATMLKPYTEKGGKKVLRFLTAPLRKKDHAFELLSKAGLSDLADHLHFYQDLNEDASNPSEIFDGIPMHMLRKLNDHHSLLLDTREEREIIKWILADYPHIQELEGIPEVVEFWARYCYEHRAERMVGEDTMETLFPRTMKYVEKQAEKEGNLFVVLTRYIQYLRGCRILGGYIGGLTPGNLERALTECGKDLEAREVIRREAELLEQQKKVAWLGDAIDGEAYSVKIVQDGRELLMAAETLHNCLGSYLRTLKNDFSRAIGLIHDREGQLVGALEIYVPLKNIIQAKGYYNNRLPEEVILYLRGYMARKGLTADGTGDI